MSNEDIKAAVEARIAREEAAGIPRTIIDPKILAGLGRIVADDRERRARQGTAAQRKSQAS
jgi:hypothetical protein